MVLTRLLFSLLFLLFLSFFFFFFLEVELLVTDARYKGSPFYKQDEADDAARDLRRRNQIFELIFLFFFPL